MTDEPRILKRRHLVYYLEVYDEETSQLLGHLVDVTTSGLKLVSKEKIPANRKYKLRMMLPSGYFSRKDLHFEAESKWSSNDINPDFYDTGFFAPNLEPAVQNIIRDLVNEISFND